MERFGEKFCHFIFSGKEQLAWEKTQTVGCMLVMGSAGNAKLRRVVCYEFFFGALTQNSAI